MIVDRLENCEYYLKGNENYAKAFEFIRNFIKKELPAGRYEIDGDNVYAMVQTYTTQPGSEKKWEAHKKYIDIQFVAKGREIIGWAPVNRLNPCGEYSDEKDFVLLEEQEEETQVMLDEGFFAVLFPEDAHKPGCSWKADEDVVKIVAKVKVDSVD